MSNRNKKKRRYTNINEKPIKVGLSVLELSRILKYEFLYDYLKLKDEEKAKIINEYRHFYGRHKNRLHLQRLNRRC